MPVQDAPGPDDVKSVMPVNKPVDRRDRQGNRVVLLRYAQNAMEYHDRYDKHANM